MPRPTNPLLLGLLAAIAMTLIGHAGHLTSMITITGLFLLGWRWWLLKHHGKGIESRWLRIFLALASLAIVITQYGTIVGAEGGTALLCLMLALKAIETQQQRDLVIAAQIGIFLTACLVLFLPETMAMIYAAINVWLYLTILLALHSRRQAPDRKRLIRQLRYSGGLMLQALPIMIILFFLFPRLPDPIWSLPRASQGGGTTGLDDKMSPGNISHLSQSDAVAFRVRFDGPVPENQRLYWRGPVLWDTDGRSWNNLKQSPRLPSLRQRITFTGSSDRYEITLEPHNRSWIYALDLPATRPRGTDASSDFVLIARQPVTQRRQYAVTSYRHYNTGPLTPRERQRALRFPDGKAPLTRQLAQQWRQRANDDRMVVDQALRYFRQQPFHYTLDPPRLGHDPTDEFLFSTRQGFCEHYAAAFTLLMRAAGIPARIVTGYQGGEFNDVGDYLLVRQRDAHAWSEVWMDGQGWLRIDPTAAVSPLRIEKGIDDALTDDTFASRQGASARLWRQTRYSFDAIGMAWNNWVLNFDTNVQASLFAALGITSWPILAIALTLALAIVMTVMIIVIRHREQSINDPLVAIYHVF